MYLGGYRFVERDVGTVGFGVVLGMLHRFAVVGTSI